MYLQHVEGTSTVRSIVMSASNIMLDLAVATDMRHPTLLQQMRQIRQAIAANVSDLHARRRTIRIWATAADDDASLAVQLAA